MGLLSLLATSSYMGVYDRVAVIDIYRCVPREKTNVRVH